MTIPAPRHRLASRGLPGCEASGEEGEGRQEHIRTLERDLVSLEKGGGRMRMSYRQRRLGLVVMIWLLVILSLGGARTPLPRAGGLQGQALAATPSPPPLVLSLEECIRRALEQNPEIREARAGVQVAQSTRDAVAANRYPQIDLLAAIGPSPRARGNHLFSPDEKDDIVITDIFARIDASIIQPLYTFGKLSNGIKAATHAVQVEKAQVRVKSAEIIRKVAEFYYGLVLARELQTLLSEAQTELDKARRRIQQLLEEGSETVTEMDLFKLDTFRGQLEKFLNEANKSAALALAALRMTIGMAPGTPFDIATKRLVPEKYPLQALSEYIETSRHLRPEFTQLREGLAARKALITVARRAYYPDVFIGVIAGLANADNRTDIDNPFIHDPFNESFATPILGLRWSLNFAATAAKVRGAEAEYRKLLEKKALAETGIPVQVEQAYREIVEAQQTITATEKAYKAARKWLVAAQANFDLGIGEARDLAEAFTEYLKMRAENFRAIYRFNLAVARLEQATGMSTQEYHR
ncbi:MAG: TolC family protein [Nitrospinota bacterium]|nr:MAG: TolC family protein [Nitrospinota bacterium]